MRNNQIFLMAIFLLVAQFTFAQTKEEIIANYIENTGGAEAWNNLKGLKMTAKVSQGGMEIPIEMVQLKDGRQMTVVSFQGKEIKQGVFDGEVFDNDIINLGFWPGGDRDGNPYVTTEITLKVADRLRTSVLKSYYNDIRKLKRKLTFAGVDIIIADIESKLYRSVFYSQGEIFITLEDLKDKLLQVKMLVTTKHQSLYIDEIDLLLNKLNLFGFHFATLTQSNFDLSNPVLNLNSANTLPVNLCPLK